MAASSAAAQVALRPHRRDATGHFLRPKEAHCEGNPVNRRIAIASAAAFLVGSGLVHLYLQKLERETSGGVPVDVLVAVKDLTPGAVLTEAAIGVRQVPEAYVDERRIRARDAKDALGVPVTTAVGAGEALVWSDLAGSTLKGRQLSGLVAEGMRAVTITSKVNLFEGLLRPGDRVDVLVTSVDGSEGGTPTTRTLLQNVLVLSVGGDLGGSGEGTLQEAQRGGASVNLSVTSEQATELAQAEHRGRLRLVLRNPNDIELVATPPRAQMERVPGAPQTERKEIEHVR